MSYNSQDTCELIRACADPCNSAAWQEFIARFQKLIAGVAMRTCERWGEYSSNAVDDLVQETYLKLSADNARLLRDFQSQQPDSIYGYLKVITANVVNDHFRARNAEKRGGGANQEDINNIQCASECQQSGSLSAIQCQVLLGEIDDCLERCIQGGKAERDKLIFRLYYRQGFSAKAIAAIPEVELKNVKGVESAILRITKLVRAEINKQSKPGEKTEAAAASEKGISQEKPSLKGEDD